MTARQRRRLGIVATVMLAVIAVVFVIGGEYLYAVAPAGAAAYGAYMLRTERRPTKARS